MTTLEEKQEKIIQVLLKVIHGEERAHGHHRICDECADPSQPGNGCPRHHALMQEVTPLKRLAEQLMKEAMSA